MEEAIRPGIEDNYETLCQKVKTFRGIGQTNFNKIDADHTISFGCVCSREKSICQNKSLFWGSFLTFIFIAFVGWVKSLRVYHRVYHRIKHVQKWYFHGYWHILSHIFQFELFKHQVLLNNAFTRPKLCGSILEKLWTGNKRIKSPCQKIDLATKVLAYHKKNPL